MSIWSLDEFTHKFGGKRYTVSALDIDVSEEWGKPEDTVKIVNKIKGFPIDIYLIVNAEEGSFGYCHKIIEDDKDLGLFITLQDKDLYGQVNALVDDINKFDLQLSKFSWDYFSRFFDNKEGNE